MTAELASLTKYPGAQSAIGRSAVIAIGIHVFFAALVCLILYILSIHSLKQLLISGSIATSGPAPQEMIVEIKLEDVKPPPTDHIEFMKQVLKPKPIVIIKPPPAPPKPTPKPVVKSTPRYTAPKATGSGQSNTVSAFHLGTGGFQAPPYPYAAREAGLAGTVVVHVTFDSSGGISSADIISSSGVIALDTNTRNFIYGHWKDPAWAGRNINAPVTYDLSGRVH